MADIKIKKTAQETSFEAVGVESVDAGLIKELFRLGDAGVVGTSGSLDEGEFLLSRHELGCPIPYNMRAIRPRHITPEMLKEAKEGNRLGSIINPFDEIDIPMDTGEKVTVVCGYVSDSWARLVLKDAYGEAVMNEDATNKGGYFNSKGRRYVLDKIWPHIDPEWKAIIRTRRLVETVDNVEMEYDDPMWLPSATDVFGPPDGRWWNEETDSFQLPIFKRERDRVKECGEHGTYPWWLRSVYASSTYYFCDVYTDGSAYSNYAYFSHGFAPGFDI